MLWARRSAYTNHTVINMFIVNINVIQDFRVTSKQKTWKFKLCGLLANTQLGSWVSYPDYSEMNLKINMNKYNLDKCKVHINTHLIFLFIIIILLGLF